jgi:hypothetical protein
MARLTAAQRRREPASVFAGPNRSFPLTDKVHDEKALQLVGRSVRAGNTTPAQATRIRARAHAALNRSR